MSAEISQYRVFLIVFMSVEVHAEAWCPYGWFGRGCKFQCRCQWGLSCKLNGDCHNNGACRYRYFGPACQYADLLLTQVDAYTPMYLVDHLDSTCNPNSSATSATLFFWSPVWFTWYRIVVNDNSSLLNITTTVNNGTRCQRQFVYRVNNMSVDVWCHIDVLVDNFTISGPVAGALCTVHASGGRNVALKQQTFQTSTYPYHDITRVQASNAVDGYTNPDDAQSSCTRTNEQKDVPYWTLNFSRPYRISKISIYTHNDSTHADGYLHFVLETFNSVNKRTNWFPINAHIASNVDVTVAPREAVKMLKITQAEMHSPVYSSMFLCEVQAMGEAVCHWKKYGLDCEAACQCEPAVECNIVTGACALSGPRHTCPAGTYGETCSSPCSDNCQYNSCSPETGHCFGCVPGYVGTTCDTACRSGTHGLACQLDCSPECMDTCNNTNGVCVCKQGFTGDLCTECWPKVYGETCIWSCPDYCLQRICERQTGECIACVGKRTGRFCEECPLGSYGAMCNLPCPEHCKFGECNVETGHCDSCESGFNGTYCTTALTVQQFHPLFLFTLVIPCTLLLVWWLVGQGRQDRFLSVSE